MDQRTIRERRLMDQINALLKPRGQRIVFRAPNNQLFDVSGRFCIASDKAPGWSYRTHVDIEALAVELGIEPPPRQPSLEFAS